MEIETVKCADLNLDADNARLHPPEGQEALRNSLLQFGQRKPIVVSSNNTVVAGNGTLQAAMDLGWETISIVRIPQSWSPEEIRAFALADNRTNELSQWDWEQVAKQVEELEALNIDMEALAFNAEMVSAEPVTRQREVGGDYTTKIKIPQYEIQGEKPDLSEIVDDTKAETLRAQIREADLPDDVRDFLLLAANRHTVFNYRKIAEFYAHQPKPIQELFEASALIILDPEDAIAKGYARFSERMMELQKQDGYDYS